MLESQDSRPGCWIVTDGKVGMESQCLGLAAALGVEPAVKRIRLNAPWRQLSPYLRWGLSFAFDSAGDPIAPPWPRILIASGRQSIPASLYVRAAARRAGERTFTIQIQNPGISPKHFDLVVTPLHDRLSGANVITTLGALHRVSPDRLKTEADAFRASVAHLAPPYLGVLVGGSNGAYAFTEDEMRDFAQKLVAFARQEGASLLITPSRRTSAANQAVLRAAIADVPHYLWDGTGANPYFGILGLADAVVVTSDSVNMTTEACATGRPVYVFRLAGGSDKFERFHRAVEEQGYARPFTGASAPGSGKRLDEMARVAGAIRQRLDKLQL